MDTTIRGAGRAGAGLGTIAIDSAVGEIDVIIRYQIPGSVRSTTSRGCTLGSEPTAPGSLLTEAPASSQYEATLKVADLAAGDHIYTVAATLDGTILSGSTIFTVPAA